MDWHERVAPGPKVLAGKPVVNGPILRECDHPTPEDVRDCRAEG